MLETRVVAEHRCLRGLRVQHVDCAERLYGIIFLRRQNREDQKEMVECPLKQGKDTHQSSTHAQAKARL